MTPKIRWAFNIKEWKPNIEQWKLCLQCVQKEEKDRCNRFCFVDDCKSSMIGRLLMRKAVSESLETDYSKITFARTNSGKPYLVGEHEGKINFNVSHNGDFCVIASELNFPIGIDVMKIENRGKRPVSEFFNLMQKQFSSTEWNFITSPGFEREQLGRFFRLWCLKESYVKATGTGISYDLQTLSFHCETPLLKCGTVTTDTKLYKDGQVLTEWIFEETLLNPNYCVAVSVKMKKELENCKTLDYIPPKFKILTFDELMKNSKPFETEDENFWEAFISKSEKKL